MDKLHQKTILISGAAQGIGLGCALSCLRHGANVVLLDKNEHATYAELKAAGFQLDSRILVVTGDVRDQAAWGNAVSRGVEKFGRLDGLVNNAGWHPPSMTIEDTSLEDFETLLRLNLTSTFLGCKTSLPHLRKTGGAIVTISSEVGLLGQPGAPAYVTSKAGQLGLMKALALDVAAEGVRVNAICPAGVMTPLMQDWAATLSNPAQALREVDAWHPVGRMAKAGEIGEVCAFLLSPEASFVTGQTICVDGGASLGYRR